MKEMCAYVLEFILTSDKMQKKKQNKKKKNEKKQQQQTNPLMCTKFEI